MLEKIYIEKPNHTDLNVYRCGIEDCSQGYSWGPALRDHYIIHYVFRGRGIFRINDKTYTVSQGQGFLISPDTIIYYEADNIEPWSYCWVGFNGVKADTYLARIGLSNKQPVFDCADGEFLIECVKQMLSSNEYKKSGDMKLLGLLYMFLHYISEVTDLQPEIYDHSTRKEEYVKRAIEYIAMNYSMPINVYEIASYIGVDRSYLFTLFKDFLNKSPSEYLIEYRIDVACRLMENKDLSIGEVSRSVGYNDQLVFSKMFKKIKGISPSKYRLQKTLNNS